MLDLFFTAINFFAVLTTNRTVGFLAKHPHFNSAIQANIMQTCIVDKRVQLVQAANAVDACRAAHGYKLASGWGFLCIFVRASVLFGYLSFGRPVFGTALVLIFVFLVVVVAVLVISISDSWFLVGAVIVGGSWVFGALGAVFFIVVVVIVVVFSLCFGFIWFD